MSYREFYENGYGVSVISSEFSYGLELAVLRGNEENAEICYDTPITDDVCGHLDSETLAEIIKDVKALPIPNHCIECDKPTFNITCDKCKEKEDHTKICDGCGETDCNGSCVIPVDEEPLSVCCSAPFTEPGWPDSDFCSKCHEHSSTWEDEDE